jgi:hypothetical protein
MTPVNDKEGTMVKAFQQPITDVNGAASPASNTSQMSTKDSQNITNESHSLLNLPQISENMSKVPANESLSLSNSPQMSTQHLSLTDTLTEESHIYTDATLHSPHFTFKTPQISLTAPQASTSPSQMSINPAHISTSRPCSPRSAVVTILSGISPSRVCVTVTNSNKNQLPVEIHSSQNGEERS